VLTASEIAHQCGFVDSSSFTQQFRKRMGVTPGGYRKKVETPSK
jgi:AraC-like DNA-binding protein